MNDLRTIARVLRKEGKINVDLRYTDEVIFREVKRFLPYTEPLFEEDTYFECLPTDLIAEIAQHDPSVFETLANIERFRESPSAVEYCRQKFILDGYVTVYHWDIETIFKEYEQSNQSTFESKEKAIAFLEDKFGNYAPSEYEPDTWFVLEKKYKHHYNKGLLKTEKIGPEFIQTTSGEKKKLNQELKRYYESSERNNKLPEKLVEKAILVKHYIKIKDFKVVEYFRTNGACFFYILGFLYYDYRNKYFISEDQYYKIKKSYRISIFNIKLNNSTPDSEIIDMHPYQLILT